MCSAQISSQRQFTGTEIGTKHGIPFEAVTKEFESRPQVRMWIRANQRGRRNLTDFQQVELALGDKADIALLAKARQRCGQGGVLLPQNSSEANSPIETREAVASLANPGKRWR